jgi:hypothetical protein
MLIEAMDSDEAFTDDENNMILDHHDNRFRRGTQNILTPADLLKSARLAYRRPTVRDIFA